MVLIQMLQNSLMLPSVKAKYGPNLLILLTILVTAFLFLYLGRLWAGETIKARAISINQVVSFRNNLGSQKAFEYGSRSFRDV